MKKYMEDMMKKYGLTMVISLIAITSLFAQTSQDLDYNIVSSGTGYGVQGSQFVIELQMKATTDVAELGSGQMTLNFNSDAMTLNEGTSSINSVIVDYGGGWSYSNDHVYSPATGVVQAGIAYGGGANPANAYDIPTSWLYFAHVVFDITDPSQTSQIAWIETTPVTQFYTEDNMTSHTNHSFTGNVDNPLPVTLSTFYAIYSNGTPTIYWTTESEEENEGWNIYRGENADALENNETIHVNPSLIPGAGTTQQVTNYQYEDEHPVDAGSTYWYWLESVDFSGLTEIHPPTYLTIPSGDPPPIPKFYGLYQNYPNPFNPNTEISFVLEEDSEVELTIYNIRGRKIRRLFKDNVRKDEVVKVVWDSEDANGKQLCSGIYLYELKSESFSEIRKMILLK
ncbi:MAG: T9SS type A sorting domain-containing protein [Candidatus Cloacimonetes bacterium]|nr:T9SS type A sorting domain-containing protein [Candidatus Cloacimonadota bacterium]